MSSTRPIPRATGVAYARAGLLGNPSDGYGGKAIALTFRDYSARVNIEPADSLVLQPGPSDGLAFSSLLEAVDSFHQVGCNDGLRLLRAAIHRFCVHWEDWGGMDQQHPRLRFSVNYKSTIPRQVGLSGSSAIVIAALRALAEWFDVEISADELAELALAAELEDLGIAAGAMDRVVQSYQGLVAMDLCEPRSRESYRIMDEALLPPLFIAWDPRAGECSGHAHASLRSRFEARDPDVLDMIEAMRGLVDKGVVCLVESNQAGFRDLMDQNFELRCGVFEVRERDRAMVSLARSQGASAKLCGSGGAIVGAVATSSQRGELRHHFREAGYHFLVPQLAGAKHAAGESEGST